MPVLNEASALAVLLPELPEALRACTTVVDNGSNDGSAVVAAQFGVRVVRELQRGYGAACLAGIAALDAPGDDDVVLFMDGDASDDVADIPALLHPIRDGTADLVIGSRVLGAADPGALPMHARFGNWLATGLIRQITGIRYTDLGPLRALRFAALRSLQMQDRNFGWTVEMQMKAARLRLRICEVPVHYRKRVGTSKISGTVSGSLRAGFSILHTIALHGR
jgi:glycosyltransferase involved in cell wall biosynthesis